MLHKRIILAASLMCVLLMYTGGCALPFIEGGKVVHLIMEGDYDQITRITDRAELAKYKGYQVGQLTWKAIAIPDDTKEADRPKAIAHLQRELRFARDAVSILPDRFAEYLVDNAKLRLGAKPALIVSVRDLRVTLRKGIMSVALPKAWVESIVTLADAKTGKVIGVAKVYGRTSSRILGNSRHLANFISRGTAKWITQVRTGKAPPPKAAGDGE